MLRNWELDVPESSIKRQEMTFCFRTASAVRNDGPLGSNPVGGQGEGTLPEVALSLNPHRRRLNESQRAMVAARTAKWMEKEAAERRGTRTDMVANLPRSQFGKTRDKAGALVSVPPGR